MSVEEEEEEDVDVEEEEDVDEEEEQNDDDDEDKEEDAYFAKMNKETRAIICGYRKQGDEGMLAVMLDVDERMYFAINLVQLRKSKKRMALRYFVELTAVVEMSNCPNRIPWTPQTLRTMELLTGVDGLSPKWCTNDTDSFLLRRPTNVPIYIQSEYECRVLLYRITMELMPFDAPCTINLKRKNLFGATFTINNQFDNPLKTIRNYILNKEHAEGSLWTCNQYGTWNHFDVVSLQPILEEFQEHFADKDPRDKGPAVRIQGIFDLLKEWAKATEFGQYLASSAMGDLNEVFPSRIRISSKWKYGDRPRMILSDRWSVQFSHILNEIISENGRCHGESISDVCHILNLPAHKLDPMSVMDRSLHIVQRTASSRISNMRKIITLLENDAKTDDDDGCVLHKMSMFQFAMQATVHCHCFLTVLLLLLATHPSHHYNSYLKLVKVLGGDEGSEKLLGIWRMLYYTLPLYLSIPVRDKDKNVDNWFSLWSRDDASIFARFMMQSLIQFVFNARYIARFCPDQKKCDKVLESNKENAPLYSAMQKQEQELQAERDAETDVANIEEQSVIANSRPVSQDMDESSSEVSSEDTNMDNQQPQQRVEPVQEVEEDAGGETVEESRKGRKRALDSQEDRTPPFKRRKCEDTSAKRPQVEPEPSQKVDNPTVDTSANREGKTDAEREEQTEPSQKVDNPTVNTSANREEQTEPSQQVDDRTVDTSAEREEKTDAEREEKTDAEREEKTEPAQKVVVTKVVHPGPLVASKTDIWVKMSTKNGLPVAAVWVPAFEESEPTEQQIRNFKFYPLITTSEGQKPAALTRSAFRKIKTSIQYKDAKQLVQTLRQRWEYDEQYQDAKTRGTEEDLKGAMEDVADCAQEVVQIVHSILNTGVTLEDIASFLGECTSAMWLEMIRLGMSLGIWKLQLNPKKK